MAVIPLSCPQCALKFEISTEAAGGEIPCPGCGVSIQVPLPASPAPAAAKTCAVCLSPIGESEARDSCPECRAEYHAECWQENGGCAVYGCSQVPVVEKRSSIEIPVSYWGQEHKQCPKCNAQILAAAVRCRHCGATFESARPEDAGEFERKAALKENLPSLRRKGVLLFIACLLPCLAPVGAVAGLVWYPPHREDFRALPPVYAALVKIGLAIAILQTIALVLVTLIFSVVRR